MRSTLRGGADGLVNVAILFGYTWTGTISIETPLTILGLLASLVSLFVLLIGSGVTKDFSDPSLTWGQIIAGAGGNLIGLLYAPQIAYMFIVNMFVTLSFGSLFFTRKEFFLAWILLSASLGGMLWIVRAHLGFGGSTTGEWVLLLTVITLALGRFLTINAETSRLRIRLHEKNKELLNLASRDELTGLWNRREFMKRLEEEASRADRIPAAFMVAIIDVDHFKSVNDRLGHLAGDAVLREIAQLLDSTRRAIDCLARYGGEEFILLVLTPDVASGTLALERMRALVNEHQWTQVAPDLHITISAGLALRSEGENAMQLLSRADAALYEAKNLGRNRVQVEGWQAAPSNPD